MIFSITSDSGHISFFGHFAIIWENATNEYPGFAALTTSSYSLEFGEIDNGNGVFLTKYGDGDIEYTKPILRIGSGSAL